MVYTPAGVLASKVYVTLARPFDTAPEVTDNPTGTVPFSRVNLTVPPATTFPELATLAISVKAWSPVLVVVQVLPAVVVVAGEPVPDKAIACGEFAASSVKENVAVRVPPAEGWNVIETVQFSPTGKAALQV